MIPDLTTLWVVFLLLLSTVLLNTLVFRPILRVIDQRAGAVREAKALAESAAQRAAAATADYDAKLAAARAEVYGQMDEVRRDALDRRAKSLAATRAEVAGELATATARVRQESVDARSALDRDATSLANLVLARVLGRAS